MFNFLFVFLLIPISLFSKEVLYSIDDNQIFVLGHCERDENRNPVNIFITIDGHDYDVPFIIHRNDCWYCTGSIY